MLRYPDFDAVLKSGRLEGQPLVDGATQQVTTSLPITTLNNSLKVKPEVARCRLTGDSYSVEHNPNLGPTTHYFDTISWVYRALPVKFRHTALTNATISSFHDQASSQL